MVCAGSGEWEALSSPGDGVLRAALFSLRPQESVRTQPRGGQMMVSLKYSTWVCPGSPPVSNPSPNKAVSLRLLV